MQNSILGAIFRPKTAKNRRKWPIFACFFSYARGREVILLGDINICHREIDLWNPQAAISASQSGFLPCERTFLDHLTSVFPPFSDAFRLKNGENTVEFGGS
eukprot:TRINITY_DN12177_c0_g1_i10.p1 TRINITY_DN12177_c0_g1~~TRINITY_DN12177_c0_g1_i10.p1  ORF type:complete len:118 (-),score=0.07 TRINITY_DN12177_c0_g1_i10:68-373(-)